MTFKLDTVLEKDKDLMVKVENTIKSSQLYQLYHLSDASPLYADFRNDRTGEFTFCLCDDAYKVTDGVLKKAFWKKVEELVNDLAIVIGDKCIRTDHDQGGHTFTVQRVGIHTSSKQIVPKSFAKGDRKDVFAKVVRLAEFIGSMNGLTRYCNFYVTFYRRDKNGKSINESYTQTISRIDPNRDNFDSAIISESARLMREITDQVTYHGFVPDLARIVARDTGDVYNLEF